MIDDSELFHAGVYDAAKAREYYLRTRKLKGRRPTSATSTTPGRGGRRSAAAVVTRGGPANRADTKSRQAELKAQQAALEKRLGHLREVLQKLVDAAKGRSGVKKPDNTPKAPETQADKADRNNDQKSKKLTAKQQTDKTKKAKETYEKEHPNTLSTDVDILQAQVKDIQAKIQKAVADAHKRRNKAGSPIADLVRPNANNPNDGPRGR